MAIKNDIFSVGKERYNEIKSFVEEMEVQLNLGKAEAQKLYNREKKEFVAFVNERKNAIRNMGSEIASDKEELVKKFEELEAKLDASTADTEKAFNKQKEEILKAIYEIEHLIKEKFDENMVEVKAYFDTFRTKLDAYRIQLALGKFEEEGKLEGRKNELRDAVGNLKEQMLKENTAMERIDSVSKELNAAFDHLRNAFKEAFN